MTASARITAFTHRGRVRERNEDTIVVGGWVSVVDMPAPEQTLHALTEPLLCAVADGMGGHRAGEVASRYVARRIAGDQAYLSNAQSAEIMLEAVNAELSQAMQGDESLLGMGTTVVGLVLAPQLVWFNVGDSRLYRYADRHLSRVSVDDVPPGPRSGKITQCLGGGVPLRPIVPHVGAEDLTAPARFLLCSDGLTDMLDDDAIEECLTLADVDAVVQLFERVMRAGGGDNVSIVLASVEESTDP